MTNDLERTLRLLEQATADGDVPAGELDPDAARLREAWLAFGETLEAAQPATYTSPLLPGEGPGVRAASAYARHRRQRLLATGLLAASLLIAVAVISMLHGPNRAVTPSPTPQRIASTNRSVVPSTHIPTKTASTNAGPQWDDSLDEQFAQVSWQMLCVRENQTYRTDAFGLAQYRMEQFRQSVEADSL